MTGFPIAFPSPPPSNAAFRGTVQPTTAFNTSGQPRIFFAGTRFNPPGVVDCLSSFDTILFAVSGIDGGAVYDFGGSSRSTSTRSSRATRRPASRPSAAAC